MSSVPATKSSPRLACINTFAPSAEDRLRKKKHGRVSNVLRQKIEQHYAVGTDRCRRIMSFIYGIEEEFDERQARGDHSRRLENDDMRRIWKKKVGYAQKSDSCFTKMRAHLTRWHYLQKRDGTYWQPINWYLKIARSCKKSCGQNGNTERSVHKFDRPLLKSKTLRLRDSKGRFYIMRDCTAHDGAVGTTPDKNLPNANASERPETAKAQPETQQTILEQQDPTKVLAALPASTSLTAPNDDDMPFDISAVAALLGLSGLPSDYRPRSGPERVAQGNLVDSEESTGVAANQSGNNALSQPETASGKNLPNAVASEGQGKANAQPAKKADDDWDFTAALARLAEPVAEIEYRGQPIVERVPEPPRTKPKKDIDPNAPVATSFHNDNQQVTHEFYNYTMRNVPYLRNVRWEIIRPRKYPIKIWRMALAGLLSKWPGQIDTDNERYLVNLAGLLMRGQRRDPRRERGYRIVRECAVSEEFAGVTAFRVSQDEAKSIE